MADEWSHPRFLRQSGDEKEGGSVRGLKRRVTEFKMDSKKGLELTGLKNTESEITGQE